VYSWNFTLFNALYFGCDASVQVGFGLSLHVWMLML